jgi:hypothetical protein
MSHWITVASMGSKSILLPKTTTLWGIIPTICAYMLAGSGEQTFQNRSLGSLFSKQKGVVVSDEMVKVALFVNFPIRE